MSNKLVKIKQVLHIGIYSFAIVGVVLSILLITILMRPSVLTSVGIHEVSSELYSCMTYKDPVLLQQIYSGEIELKEARKIANTRSDIADEYTECLKDIFGYHTVWVNENDFIVYD